MLLSTTFCQQRRKTGVPSKNQNHDLAQTNFARDNLEALDTKAFGDKFPSQPGLNYSIITFQIMGQMNILVIQHKSIQIVVFDRSNASLALCAKHSLNKTKIPFSDRFHQRMLITNQKLLSKLS